MASFVLRDLPEATWAEFEARAKREGRPLRPLLLALVESYVKHGLPDGVTSPIMSRARSDRRVSFVAPCGKGHLPVQEFDRLELEAQIEGGVVQFWCNPCGESRLATSTELGNLKRRLADGTI